MMSEYNVLSYVSAIAVILIAIFIRLILVLPATNFDPQCVLDLKATTSQIGFAKTINSKNENKKKISIMALLGSGGHTGEMIRLLSELQLKQFNLTWLVSEGDTTSIVKAQDMERKQGIEKVEYILLARARKVGEPFVLSIISSLRSLVQTASVLGKSQTPDILLINGPGTCVPVAYVLFLLRFLGIGNTRIIYIESLARVNGLSLSGKFVFPISDRFIVQWRPLAEKYRRAEYHGILI